MIKSHSSTPSTGTGSLDELVTAVFRRWRGEGIRFLILRNYEKLPEETTNDIDVLVLPEQLAAAERQLVRTAREIGYHLHNRAEFSPVSLFFFNQESLLQIQFDLFASLNWRGLALLSPRAVLARRVNRGSFCVPHPADEAVNNLLTRLIYHGYVKEKYKPAILDGFREHANQTNLELEQMFGGALARDLTQAINGGNWLEVEHHSAALRRQLVWRQLARQPFATSRSLVHDLARFARRLLRPPGLVVVLLGADGSGKSTVAGRVIHALSRSFAPEKGLRVHWKPTVFLRRRRAQRPPTSDPHGQQPRGRAASLLFLVYHWFEFVIGAWTQFLPVRFRNGLVMIERFHYDFAVDPLRYRLRVPDSFVRRLFAAVPSPDLVFLLDAPPEVLRSRKQEVPLEETRRQCELYRALLARLKMGKIINCEQPLDNVVADIVHKVLSHLENRQRRRTGNAADICESRT